MKQSDTNYDKEIKVDNLFIAADKHDELLEERRAEASALADQRDLAEAAAGASESDIKAEQINGYFKKEIPDEMLPDWMKDNEALYNTDPKDWTGVIDLDGPTKSSTMIED